jgi:hypothetical protein
MNDFAGTLNTVPNVIGGFAAGKSKIINGDFFINQRNYTTGTANGDFVCDRNRMFNGDGTVTATLNTFTLGAAPVAGYEAKNFVSIQSTGQTLTTANSRLAQDIESVRTLAGQNVTVSFWAKAASGTPKVAVELGQEFGTGGSPSTAVLTYAGQVTLTTSWARYSVSVALPSISGKTLGTNANDFLRCALWTSGGSAFNSRTGSIGIQTNTIDFWGFQVEAGSIATPFQTATGTIQGELAAAQRYYWRSTANDVFTFFNMGVATTTTRSDHFFQFPVRMRVKPTAIESANLLVSDGAGGNFTATALILTQGNTDGFGVHQTGSTGMTQFRPLFLEANNTTAAYVAFSAEL